MKQKEIYLDELTGAFNRRYLYYWVDTEIKRANRFAKKFALILLDIDNFRDINNTYGHLEGDLVLTEFVKFLRGVIREVDILVRYGGDEFIVLVPNTTPQGTMELAQRILSLLNKSLIANHKILCSIGYAIYPDDGATIETLISLADNLMYNAKKEGKNRIGLKREVIKKLQIPSPVVIGREEETQWCLNQLNEYRAIFIAGEAGIGKTRLVLEVKKRQPESFLLRANSYAALSSVPYHPIRNMLNEVINSEFALVQHIFKQMPEIYKSEIMKLLPEETTISVRESEMDKFRLFNSITTFILKIAEFIAPRLLFVFIDDLHWTDLFSVELLDFLLRSIKGNIRVFGTYRIEEIKGSPVNEFFSIWAREKLYTQIKLSPLNESQTFKMLESIMGVVSHDFAQIIYKQCGGNPFYTEEILRELYHRHSLFWNGREWILMMEKDLTIPSSIEEVTIRKLKFLSPETKNFLEIAAVLGQEFDAEIISLAANRNVGETLDVIDQLVKMGFIKERQNELFFFSEDMVRQIVYKNIPRGDLIKYHRAVGEAIEKYYHSTIPSYYEQLAHHFTLANDPQKALFYSKEAGLKCKKNYAHNQAIEFLTNALRYEENIAEIFKIKLSLGEISYLSGNYTNAIKHLSDCRRTKPGDFEVYRKLGQVYEDIGDYRNALKIYREGMKITKGHKFQYYFQSAIAWVYTRLGDYLKAKRLCERILKGHKSVPLDVLGDTCVTIGVVFLRTGEYDRAESYIKRALKIRESLKDKKGMAACYLDLAIVYVRNLNPRVCEKLYKKALALYEEIGYQQGVVIVLLDLGSLLVNYDLVKAEEYYLKGLEIAKLLRTKIDLIYLYNHLGSLNFRRLMDEQALENYKKALELAREINFKEGIIFINNNMSELYRERGLIKKGMAHLKRAAKVANELGLKYSIYGCEMEEIEYLLLKNNLLKANRLSKKLYNLLKSEVDLRYRVYSFIYRGRVLVAMKKYAQAHLYYQQALEIFKSCPENSILGEIYYLLGILLKKENKNQEALKMFLTAKQIFSKIGNLFYIDKIEKEVAG
uniref:Diguanylate cyclase n=1 Tax=candidate division WOR-3 bacterium TaxID=2052148 RepID=A0A7C4XAG5_UNCW3